MSLKLSPTIFTIYGQLITGSASSAALQVEQREDCMPQRLGEVVARTPPPHPTGDQQAGRPQAAVRMGQGHPASKTSQTSQEFWDEQLIFNPSISLDSLTKKQNNYFQTLF